jgi:hypothetical protein
VTDDEFKMLWAMITGLAQSAQLIPIDKVKLLIETVNRAETIMPIFDPTAYRDGAENLDHQRTLARGFLKFREAIEQVKSDAAPRG